MAIGDMWPRVAQLYSNIVYALAGGAWFQKHNIRQLQNDKLTKLRFVYKLFFSKIRD